MSVIDVGKIAVRFVNALRGTDRVSRCGGSFIVHQLGVSHFLLIPSLLA